MHEAVWSREQALAVLERPDRGGSEDPGVLWRRVGLRPGMTVVDVGAGTGYYALPASDVVGARGRVYAVDVSAPLVALLRERSSGRPQLRAVRSRPDRIPLSAGIADRVLLANLLHGVAPSTVAEAVRSLGPGGRLVDVDWRKATTSFGPPIEHRLSRVQARHVLELYGLKIVDEAPFGPSHYLLVAARRTERSAVRTVPERRPAPEGPPATLERIRQEIALVPKGKVATYGEVARAAGFPRAARLAVWALRHGSGLPWHRVVAAGGRIALGGEEGREQRLRLEVEGVTFRAGRVRMERHHWMPRGPRSPRVGSNP